MQSLSLNLTTQQVLGVTLSSEQEVKVLGLIAGQVLAAKATAEVLTRTYHLGLEPTPGRGYDDRLTMRTGYGLTKLRELLALPVHKGGLRHQRNGRNYIVTERAVLEYFGEEEKEATTSAAA